MRSLKYLHKPVLIIIFISLMSAAVYSLYFMHHIQTHRSIGEQLVATTEQFIDQDGQKGSFLIIGDSLAYGVGSTSPEQSFAGILSARYPDHQVVNRAVIGYDVEDLAGSVTDLIDKKYNAIFIIIGGNDIIRYRTDLDRSADNLAKLFSSVSGEADQAYVITTGDFKSVSMVPVGLKNYYSERSHRLRLSAMQQAEAYSNLHYIDAFRLDKEQYSKLEAKDGFHLNDRGISDLVDLTLSHPTF